MSKKQLKNSLISIKKMLPRCEQANESSQVRQIIKVDELRLKKESQLLLCKFKRYKKEIGREKWIDF